MTTDTTSGRIPMPNHWVPRFVSAGVPYEDMRDLLQRIDTWDIWCREWSAKGAAHEQLGEAALTEGRLVTANLPPICSLQRSGSRSRFKEKTLFAICASPWVSLGLLVSLLLREWTPVRRSSMNSRMSFCTEEWPQ